MIAEIVAVGSELVDGQKLDTNSRWLSHRLGDLGVAVRFHTSVGDDLGTFWASGYEGQSIMICPPLDLVVVRLGRSQGDDHTATLRDWRAALVEAFR